VNSFLRSADRATGVKLIVVIIVANRVGMNRKSVPVGSINKVKRDERTIGTGNGRTVSGNVG
jgi:hypothetical protein